jgi:AraC family transcriptional activator of pobA
MIIFGFAHGFEEAIKRNWLYQVVVGDLANRLNVSSRYLTDLLKVETGKTAIELIHITLINEAKNRLRKKDKTVSEIAYELGFENMSYFSRLFKKETGMLPTSYKNQFLN